MSTTAPLCPLSTQVCLRVPRRATGPLSRDSAVPATPMKNSTLGQQVCSPALPKQIWSSVLSWPCVMHSGDRNVQRATCSVRVQRSIRPRRPIQTASYNVANAPTALEGKARERSMRLHRTPAGMARVPWHSDAAASWRCCRMLYDGCRYHAACQVSVAGIGAVTHRCECGLKRPRHAAGSATRRRRGRHGNAAR